MIVKLKNEVIFKNKNPLEIQKSKTLQEKIISTWQQLCSNNDNVFNGDIYTVTNIITTKDRYELELGKAKFADLVYAKNNSDLKIYSLFTAALFKTKDDYYIVAKDNTKRLNLFGGMASDNDFENNIFIPYLCLKRELKEELGISIDDKNIINSYYPKFLKIPNKDENMFPVGIIYIVNLNYTKEEFINYFNKYKNSFDKEIIEILFYTKNNYLDIYKEENIREYIVEVIKLLET